MNSINKTTIIVAASTLIIGFLLGLLIFGGSSSKEQKLPVSEQPGESVEEWTCSMHPSVRQSEPGKCPICGMDLIPVSTDSGDEPAAQIRMSQAAIQLANIRTSPVTKGIQPSEVRLNGKVQPNEQHVYTQTSHIKGRIEKLLLSYTGEQVDAGQEIAFVYSPELVLAQKELFEAHRIRETQPELYVAAREKLKSWKFTDNQIDQIIANGKPIDQFPITSDITGVVLSKNVNVGDYVQQGAPLYEIADLSKLWVLFEVHESDMPRVHVGDVIEYKVQSIPGETFSGKISFIDPVIDPKTRVAMARINVNNKGQRLKPEMFVTGYFTESRDADYEDIVVPKTAVMWTGKRSIVYVKSQTDAGVAFEMREVVLGPALGDHYVVEEGLQEGEEIATYGTFSIDAAAQLAGKPSMMSPEGGSAMTGHQHGDAHEGTMPSEPVVEVEHIDLRPEVDQALHPVIDRYLMLKDALVNDDFELAKREASGLLSEMQKINMDMFEGNAHQIWMDHGLKAKSNLTQIDQAENIGLARAAFKPFSEHLIRLVEIFNPYDQKLYVQHCPMADDFKGANWLSTEENIMNPYFGESMLTCGEVQGEISNQ